MGQGEQLPAVHLTLTREAERLSQGHTAKVAPGMLTTSRHISQGRGEGELPRRRWLETFPDVQAAFSCLSLEERLVFQPLVGLREDLLSWPG